jgi:nitrate reductase NapE component
MSEDIENRIKNIEELVEDNNDILHKMRKREIISFWFGIIKLFVVLGVFYYGYHFAQPYINKLWDLYSSLQQTSQSVKKIENNVSVPQLNVGDFLKKLSAENPSTSATTTLLR